MAYRTVFDITGVAFLWWFPLLGLIVGLMFAAFGLVIKRSSRKASRQTSPLLLTIGLTVAVLSLGYSASLYLEYRGIRKALADQSHSVVEGVVADFKPITPNNRESFVIDGKRFDYGAGRGSTGFNADHNKGFIRNGVQARITYAGKNIIRVEVK